jgi:L-ribulose-5-phosphate 3-epimerase
MTIAKERLAVCSWSLQPETPEQLVSHLQDIGIHRVQLALDPLMEKPSVWGRVGDLFQASGVTVASGMMTTVGEDYSTLETIRETGGVVPDATWEQNWTRFQKLAPVAQSMGIRLVTFHAGFLPHDPHDPSFTKLRHRIEEMAELFGRHGMELGLETGQETAGSLAAFLKGLRHGNVGVNFDPANMLLYDQGDPVEAVRTLAPWLKQVHLKDADRTKVPGTWGTEVPVGSGQVDWPRFLAQLEALGYQGNLCFEREAGDQRVKDIQAGWGYLKGLGVGIQ